MYPKRLYAKGCSSCICTQGTTNLRVPKFSPLKSPPPLCRPSCLSGSRRHRKPSASDCWSAWLVHDSTALRSWHSSWSFSSLPDLSTTQRLATVAHTSCHYAPFPRCRLSDGDRKLWMICMSMRYSRTFQSRSFACHRNALLTMFLSAPISLRLALWGSRALPSFFCSHRALLAKEAAALRNTEKKDDAALGTKRSSPGALPTGNWESSGPLGASTRCALV